MAIVYDDFVLRLVTQGDGRLLAQVDCPTGSGAESLSFHGVDDLPVTLDQLVGGRGAPTRELYDPNENEEASSHSPEAVGHRLYSFLFTGRVRDLFERSLGAAKGADRGLRLVFRFDPREPGMDLLSRLPWELLYKQETGQFLTLDPRTPLVRYLDNVPQPTTLPPLRETLRVLVVVPHAPGLDLGKELAILAKSFEGLPVALTYLIRATRDDLVRSLTTDRSHILHFLGHGGLDSTTGQGFLALTGPDNRADHMSGTELATLVRSSTTLRFVFLNACQTGGGQGAGEHGAFAGVANALVLRGVPAVLAMQARVADDDAIRFAQAVYRNLTLGSTLEEAVGLGRRVLHAGSEASGTSVLANPVLLTRTREQVVSVLNPIGISVLWTVLGLLAVSLTFNVWSRTCGWNLHLPGFGLSDVSRFGAATYGHFLGIPLLYFLLSVMKGYQRTRANAIFADRLPVAFGIPRSLPGRWWRGYQIVFFCLFLLFPLAGQLRFFYKMCNATVYDWEPPHITYSPWALVPWSRILDDKYVLVPRGQEGSNETFIPFWEPLVFLLALIGLLLYFGTLCWELFGGGTGPLLSRRGS